MAEGVPFIVRKRMKARACYYQGECYEICWPPQYPLHFPLSQ